MPSEYKTSDEAKSFDPQELTRIACQQMEQSILYKRPRLEDIKKNEDLYLGKVQKPLKGRFNVPVPVMSGFVDTLLSKVDERIRIQFKHQEIADYRAAKKITAAWEIDSSPNRGKWSQKDRVAKKLAILSGVAVFEQYAEDPYKSCLEVIDYNDFHCEPLGGQDLEKHLFLGVDNVFRTQAELEAGVEKGLYDKKQVAQLKMWTDTPEVDKQNNDAYQDKLNRFIALGLSPTSNSYVGQKVFNLVKWGMVHNGVRYYLLFDYRSKIWLRCDELNEVYPVKKDEQEIWPWTSWHTHEDSLVFWNKAPADDVRPIAESIRVLINQELENRNKRNFGMRGYDPKHIKDPTKLRWEPEGLVAIETDGSGPVSNFIYEFQVGALEGTINLVQWMDQFLGRKTGVTNDVQGSSTEDKVGIYQGNLQQVAERIGLMSKSYQDCYTDLGLRYVRLLREHLSAGFAVKMIGESGIEWAEITKDDVNPLRDFDIVITGGSAEDQLAVLEKNRKVEAVKLVLTDPELRMTINKKWAVKEFLVNGGGYTEEELKIGMDTNNEADLEAVSRAAQENQDLIAGADVEPDRLANTAHIQHHINFAFSQKLNPKIQFKIMALIEAEMPIAAENMARKAFLQTAGQPQAPQLGQQPTQPQIPQSNPEPIV